MSVEEDPVDEAFPMPPQITYQQTLTKVQSNKNTVETLAMYTKRQMKRALNARITPKEQQQEEERAEEQGAVPEKRRKFNLIDYFS